MFQTKEKVFDRIEQSIKLFLTDPLSLALPLVLLQASITIFWSLILSLIPFPSELGYENLAIAMSYALLIAGSFGIVYLIAIMIVKLALILWIMQIIKGEAVTPKENIIKIWWNIKNIFTLYWYVFQYVYLYPCIGIIAWGLILIGGVSGSNSGISFLGGIIIFVSCIWLTISAITRWVGSTFAIYHGIFQNDYSKQGFQTSIAITEGNWWRIVWNLFLVGFIIWVIGGLFDGIFGIFKLTNTDLSSVNTALQSPDNFSAQFIQGFESEIRQFQDFNILNTFLDTISASIGITLWVMMSVFIAVFYLRLLAEYTSHNTQNNNAKAISEENSENRAAIPQEKIEL